MTELARSRIRGLVQLGHDAVDLGTDAIQGYHRAIADLPFEALELVPGLADPSRAVRAVHDQIVDLVYGSIRLGNRAARAGTRWAARTI